MRVFVAGAAGAIGRQLVPMLIEAGHVVTGTTRSADRAAWLRGQGAHAVVVDVFDATALRAAVVDAGPHVVVHQLTDLAAGFGVDQLRANARLRQFGTRNLMDAALAAGASRMVAQSGAWLYAPGPEPHTSATRSSTRQLSPITLSCPASSNSSASSHRRPASTGWCCATASSTARARIARIPVTTPRSMSSRPPTQPRERSTADRPGSTTSSTTADRSATLAHARNWAGSPAEARQAKQGKGTRPTEGP